MTNKKQYKKCGQCGQILTLDDFKIKRTRADGSKARSRYCRECEIDTRNYLALVKQQEAGILSPLQESELAKLNRVFAILEKQGLSTPLSRSPAVPTESKKSDHLEAILAQYAQELPAGITPKKLVDSTPVPSGSPEGSPRQVPTVDTSDIPEDLGRWLTETFESWREASMTPEYLNDVVYPTLKAQYRPETGWDAVKLVQTYDDTYKAVLNKISDRFWEYEDWWAEQAGKPESSSED